MRSAASSRADRLLRGRLLLRAMERDGSKAGRRYAEQWEALGVQARRVLPSVVGRAVAMPLLAGLDVGDRIVYERPAPYQHVIEYVEAGAQRLEWDDPRGTYRSEASNPPDRAVLDYVAAVGAFCERWGLRATWAVRLVVFAHVHSVHGLDDPQAAERAIDELTAGADAPPEIERDAAWVARRLLDPGAGIDGVDAAVVREVCERFAEQAALTLPGA